MKVVFHAAILPGIAERWGTRQPLGFGYLSAWLKRNAPQCEVHYAKKEEDIFAEPADIYGLSAVSYNYGHARKVARRIKEKYPDALVVLGGPHLTALPDRMDREFDFGVLGEGEKTFGDLVERLSTDWQSDCADIPGLVYWPAGDAIAKPSLSPPHAELIEPLDAIPFPDRSIFGPDFAPDGAISLITSRGCLYDCPFCSSKAHWGRLRAHSAAYVLEEIEHVFKHFQAKFINFEDDLFVADRRRLVEIAEGILRKNYGTRLGFRVSARANLLNEEICEILKSINTKSVFIGFESNRHHVLKSLGKTAITPEINQRAVDLCRKAGLRLIGSFIFASPGETADDAYDTYQFIQRNLDAFDLVGGGCLRLLPGTKFWREAEARGLIDEKLTGVVWEEDDLDFWRQIHDTYPMLNDTMSRGEVAAWWFLYQEMEQGVNYIHIAHQLHEKLMAAERKNIDHLGIKKTARSLLGKIARKLSVKN